MPGEAEGIYNHSESEIQEGLEAHSVWVSMVQSSKKSWLEK